MSKNAMLRMTDEQHKLLDRFTTIFRTNGYDPVEGKTVSIKDALDIQNAAFMIPRAMTQIVQEGIEPLLIGTSLLQRIQYHADGLPGDRAAEGRGGW